MKKILLSSIVLLIFALSITIFQISCQKDADAETPSSQSFTPIEKVTYIKNHEMWICNYDGTNNTRVNLSLPSGVILDENDFFLSPDGEKIFFNAGPADSYGTLPKYTEIYSCNNDGSNVTKIVSNDTGFISIGDVK